MGSTTSVEQKEGHVPVEENEQIINTYSESEWRELAKNVGLPIIHAMIMNGDCQALQTTLSNGSDMNMIDDEGRSVLQFLVKFGDHNFTKVLQILGDHGAEINQVDENGSNILFLAGHSKRPINDLDAIIGIGGNWNVTDNDGKTVLHVAALSGNVQAIEYFSSKECDVNAMDKDGCSPLHAAVFLNSSAENWEKTIESLINAGADVNAVDNTGNNVLINAANFTLAEAKLEFLVNKGANLNAQNKEGYSVLHMAAEAGNVAELDYFLSKGVNVNCRDRFGRTPLFLIKEDENAFKEMVNLFLANSADISAVDGDGNSVIFDAVRRRVSEDNLEYLLSLGAPWKEKNVRGETILHIAAMWGNCEALKYFVSKGADIKEKSDCKATPLHLSMFNENGFKETISTVLSLGGDINDADDNDCSVILLAAMYVKSDEKLEYLVSQAKWNVPNSAGDTVLHLAPMIGNVEAMKYFISKGADVNAKNDDGETPLTRTLRAEKNFEECVRVLVENGADINVVDDEGTTLISQLESHQDSGGVLQWLTDTKRI